MLPALVDTDVLSEILKARRPTLTAGVERYVREHGRLTFSAITLYEIERGLLAKRATRLLTKFQAIAEVSNVEDVRSTSSAKPRHYGRPPRRRERREMTPI